MLGCDWKLIMVCYKVCSDIKVGKKKLVFKFDSLHKKTHK
jgi:hypothetical protein